MPMDTPQQHGASDVENPYCMYCTEPDGAVKPFHARFEGMVGFMIEQNHMERSQAEIAAREYLAAMPEWNEYLAAQ
jgi:hypothetical protein